MAVLEHLDPKDVFYYFEEICRIPHGSGNTGQISDYLANFARERNLSYIQDELGNVIIRKPAAPGYENVPGVILQGHMDMVAEKTPESDHDFTKDGLKLKITEDGYITAEDTTLGGDDGIAIAYGLALLAGNYPHPALELLVTVDEEIGMLGASGLDCSQLQGRRMINLDSEEEGSIWVSCAGGMRALSRIPVEYTAGEGVQYTLKISGLLGGHSGSGLRMYCRDPGAEGSEGRCGSLCKADRGRAAYRIPEHRRWCTGGSHLQRRGRRKGADSGIPGKSNLLSDEPAGWGSENERQYSGSGGNICEPGHSPSDISGAGRQILRAQFGEIRQNGFVTENGIPDGISGRRVRGFRFVSCMGVSAGVAAPGDDGRSLARNVRV